MPLRLGLVLSLLALGAGSAPAQGPRAGLSAGPSTEGRPRLLAPVGTERVEVDLVVRDKDGRLVRDLRLDEVEVLEDGVRQDVESLTLVEHAAGGEPGAEPVYVALAFDRLGPASRRFARRAALEYLAGRRPGSEAAVFAIDRRLTVLQGFTDDAPALREAVESMTSLAATTLAGRHERQLTSNAYHGLGEGLGQAHVAAAESKGAPECRGREEVRIRLNEMLESRLVESFESLERDQQGFASTHALLSLVGGLSTLPGRKAVLLFSEGLAIPSNVEATYRSVIGAANRARVSVYTLDAGGLRVESPADELRRTLDMVKTRARNESDGGRLTEESLLSLQERNESAMRLAPASTLTPLADQTGGFALADTNDLAAGLSRVEEELRSHHLLSYAPRNRAFDGRFRTIRVKVSRPHGRLQARKGYLARLDVREAPGDVPLRVQALQFPQGEGAARVPILVEAEAGGLEDLTILVLVRDAGGQVVAKASQEYALPLAEASRAPVLFYREVRLPAGLYTLEAVAQDARSSRGGQATASLEVPRGEPGRLRASSLMVVRRAEKLAAGRGGEPGPLEYQDVLLYPDLGPRLRRGSGQPLAFFLSAWPAPGRPGVDARVEVLRSGRPVAAASPFAVRPDADGRIGLVSTFPVDALAPGSYELRVTLTDGRDAETRTASLAISP